MIRGLAILAGIALIITGILVCVIDGFTVDGRFIILCGGGLALAIAGNQRAVRA